MKSSNTFRGLKRSVEAALKVLSNGAAVVASFPDSGFTTCVLLIALKVLEARGQLDRVGCADPKLTMSNASDLILKLYNATNAVCPSEIQIKTELEQHEELAQALKCLDENSTELWLDDFTIGYAYQFLSMAGRKNAQANIQNANKEFSKSDLIAFTQLYTPRWVVDFLLANSLLPQLKTSHNQRTHGSSTKLSMDDSSTNLSRNGPSRDPSKHDLSPDFAIDHSSPDQTRQDLSPDFSMYTPWMLFNDLHGSRPINDLSIIDPACGAGNFLVRALDLVINIYKNDGRSAHECVNLAQAHNIHGADIDHAALWITCLALLIKSFQYSDKPPESCFKLSFAGVPDWDNVLGSLSRALPKDHLLNRTYAVVLMNPPYVGRKLMSRQLKSAIKENYPNSHNDICAAFIERSLELLKSGGRLGVITQASILTLPSYGDLRKLILTDYKLIACADAGTGVFPLQGGDKVNSAMLLIENNKSTSADKTIFFDLRMEKNKEDLLVAQSRLVSQSKPGAYSTHQQSTFLEEHESAIKYGCPGLILSLSRRVPCLADVADIRQGLATTNNEKFVRPMNEVSADLIGSVWIPYVKGAGADRWFSPVKYVVKWENDGREIKEAVSTAYPYLKGNTKWVVKNEQYYFRSGLCFSFVNTGNLAVRKLPEGCIFDVGASAVFVNDKDDEDFLLSYLNSSLIAAIATSINPTINFQVGDIKRLPMFPFNQEQKTELSKIARNCCALAEELHALKIHDLVVAGNISKTDHVKRRVEIQTALAALERRINQLVLSAFSTNFGLTADQQAEITKWLESKPEKT